MLKLFIITATFFPQDSTQKDTILPESIMLMKRNSLFLNPINNIKYLHQQGFFCDFEDKISKNSKLFFNLGVGDQ